MGQAIDVGDAATTLEQSRAAAESTAKTIAGGALTAPDAAPAPPLQIGRAPQVKKAAQPGPPDASLMAPDLAAAQPTGDQLPHGDLGPAPPPAEKTVAAKPGAWDQTGTEIQNGVMRGFAELGRAAALIGSVPAVGADAVHSLFSGKDEHAIQDVAFKAIDHYANQAVDYWHPEDQSKSGIGAQVAGDVAGVVPALLTGPAALPALTAKAVSDTGIESVRAGQDAKTAGILAAVAGVTNALGMKIPLKSPSILKRIASSVFGNLALNAGTETLTKEILASNGYKEAAAKIDLTDPRTLLSTIAIAIGFGLHRQAGDPPKVADAKAQAGTKIGEAPPPADATVAAPAGPPGDEGATPPPPPPSPSAEPSAPPQPTAGASAPVPSNVGVEPGAGQRVQDMPSIEPAKDMRAQIRDMNDKATPRVGVLIAKDSLASLTGSKDANALSVNGTLNQARTQGRTIVLPQGELMLKTAKIAKVTRERLAKGEDPQAVIGSVTGAGSGKTADMTAVVQGHDEKGNVVVEKMVKPEDIQSAADSITEQGKKPVVTTPEEAVKARINAVSQERNAPTEMGIMTHPDGREIAVHVEPGAPDGMVRVRQLDAEGEPSAQTIDVEKSRVKVGAPEKPVKSTPAPDTEVGASPEKAATSQVEKPKAEETPTPPIREAVGPTENAVQTPTEDTSPPKASTEKLEPVKEPAAEQPKVLKAKPIQSALESLPAALEAHEKQEQLPKGKKFSGPLGERQENAVAFGAVLKAAADNARGKVGASAIDRAVKAAKAVGNLATKGQEATAKGQGTGHTKLTALVNEMHRAARELLGTAREGDEIKVSAKEEELKAKRARTEARVIKAAKEAAAEPKSEPVDEMAAAAARTDKEKAIRKAFDHFGSIDSVAPEDLTELSQKVSKILGKDYKVRYDEDEGADLNHALEQLKEAPKPAPKVTVKKAAPKKAVTPKAETETTVTPKSQASVDKTNREREGQRLMQRYIAAEEHEAPGVRSEIEQFLHEHMSDLYTPDQQREVMHLMDDQRLEQNPDAVNNGPRRMSDTVEEEEQVQQTDAKTLKVLGLRNAGKHALAFATTKLEALKNIVFNNRMQGQYKDLATAMIKAGHMGDIVKAMDTGRAMSTHDLLNRMLAGSDDNELKGLIQNLRTHVPDLPIHIVSEIQNLHTGLAYGKNAQGTFDPVHDSIQVVPNRKSAEATLKTIVHEAVHAATAYEITINPTGPLNTALENARRILVARLSNSYSRDVVEQNMAYMRGDTQVKPELFNRALYGLTDTKEMLSELYANPDFVQEIADSESFAQPGENFNDNFLGGAKTLLHKIFGAIGRFLGVKEPKLLQHIAGLGEKVMDIQQQKTRPGKALDYLNGKKATDFEGALVSAMREKFGSNPLEISRAVPAFMDMAREPARLRSEDLISRSFADEEEGREATGVARLFKQAMNSGAVDAVRAIKTALKTVPQIYRDHRADFGGRDDPANPLVRLQEIDQEKTKIQHDLSLITRPVARAWSRLNDEKNLAVGDLLRDSTMYKLDPRKGYADQVAEGKESNDSIAKHSELYKRLSEMPEDARKVFSDALDTYKTVARAVRRANIDTALESFSETPLTDAQKQLLYSARTPEAYDSLVGEGKLINVGENNDKLRAALGDFAGQSELQGPYAHLGRNGEYVVSAKPEGTRAFKTEEEAKAFVDQVGGMSPGSKGTYEMRGGEHTVDYKLQYTSFHETRNDALEEAKRMNAAGYKVGMVTRKTLGRDDTPMSAGARDLVAAAESKINRSGKSEGNDALIATLRSALLQNAAARSAYAGSRMARQNFAGVKGSEMRKNFADYMQSTIWHTAQLRTTFKQASALAKVRDMARDTEGADQATMFRRGEAVNALNKHMQDEVQNFGHKSPINAAIARLGFMSFLASPSHAFIWMTQNFTTGIPVAGARWGYMKATGTFSSAMGTVLGPAMRDSIHETFAKGGDEKAVNAAMLKTLGASKRWSKWVPQIQEMIDRGVLGHSYSAELHEMAQATKQRPLLSAVGLSAKNVNIAFDFARILPSMADSFNRVSTALVGLELTGGNMRKAMDFVDEVHADYSAQAKPLAFKKIGRVPGANSITMFKTYVQSMIHLFYGNLKAAMPGNAEGKMEAAKTAAGMVVGNMLFAGVYGAAAIEPLKLAIYAYHKLFDKEGEVFDLKNAIHRWLVEHMGKKAGDIAAGGLPHIAGFDLSSRMGLTDLFLHDPPDLFSADKEHWADFALAQTGPMGGFLADRTTEFVKHMQKGEGFQAVGSLVPVKAYQDAVKGLELATSGKKNSLGGRMTESSGLDAAYQAFGLKPSSVADAQERAGTAMNFKTQVKATRESIIKAYVSADPGAARLSATSRMNAFNRLHPAEAIRPGDVKGLEKAKQMSQSTQPGRDSTLNKMLNY